MPRNAPTLSWVPGVSVGHATDRAGRSGVTVVVFRVPAPTVVDVRGGASGTFDTASLALDATFGARQALFLSGGSLYGLDAARGIRRALLELGLGVRAFGNPHRVVPISGAILFDLPRGRTALPDYEALGFRAAKGASRAPVRTGAVGAGAGATVGKYLGRDRGVPGGVGSIATEIAGLGRVGVLVAVNAVGAVRDPSSGRWVAGPSDRGGSVVPWDGSPGPRRRPAKPAGTTLAVVATDAPLPRSALQRLAVHAHAGLARTVGPAHTSTDGDVVFVSSTARSARARRERYPGATVDRMGLAVERLVPAAILGAVSPSRRRR